MLPVRQKIVKYLVDRLNNSPNGDASNTDALPASVIQSAAHKFDPEQRSRLSNKIVRVNKDAMLTLEDVHQLNSELSVKGPKALNSSSSEYMIVARPAHFKLQTSDDTIVGR